MRETEEARRRIPGFLRELRTPWLADVPPGPLAGYVRFASVLTAREDRRTVVRYTSGGSGTIIEESVDDPTYAALGELIGREYFDKKYQDEAREELAAFLAPREVDLLVSSKHVPRGAFEFAREILELLPAGHLDHGSFRTLELGGWGHGAAKCSEYDDGTVQMFSFAVKGPRRNFAALLLHETAHAYFAELDAADPVALKGLFELHLEVVRGRPGSDFFADTDLMPFAVDYLLGVQSRVSETLPDAREFAAEVYLLYVVRGLEMKDRIAELPPGLRTPWEKVYEAYRGFFGGVEYE